MWSEQNDLASSKPDVVLALDHRMMDNLRAVNAAMPKPNPDYVAGGLRSGDSKGGSKGSGKKPPRP